MVNICNPPPGASSTFANICRAFLRASGPASAPIASRSWNRILSSNWTHDANNWLIRSAISEAPAFVNVMHSRFSGSTSFSNSNRMTRAVSTCVFPVPADALSQILSCGTTALLCANMSGWSVLAALLMSHPRQSPDGHSIPASASIGHSRHKAQIPDAAWR